MAQCTHTKDSLRGTPEPESKFCSTSQLPECKLDLGVLDEESGDLKCPILPRNSMSKDFMGLNSNSSLHVYRQWWVIYKTPSDTSSCGGGREEIRELMLQTGKQNRELSGLLEVPQLTARKQAGLTPCLALLCV